MLEEHILLATAKPALFAIHDSYTTSQGQELIVFSSTGVLANDIDPNDGTLSAMLVSNPSNGWLMFYPNGGFYYGSNPGFSGTDSFTYMAVDGRNSSDSRRSHTKLMEPSHLKP